MEESTDILIRFISGECNEEEKQMVLTRLASEEEYRKSYATLRDVFFCASLGRREDKYQHDGAIRQIFSHTVDRKSRRMISFRRYGMYAAAVAVLLFVSSLFFDLHQTTPDAAEYIGYNVPMGLRTQITLPDGSAVWLNGGSRIRYATNFGKNERRVELDGEAYFEVKKNSEVPFIIDAKELEVRVFGTKFNMNCYSEDDKMVTSLDEGHIGIRLKAEGVGDFMRLEPKEQAVFTRDDKKLVKETFTSDCSWKDGFLILKQDNTANMIKKIERRYGVTIHIDNIKNNNYLYTGTFSGETLKDLLDAIDFLTPVDYTITGNNVRIVFK